ncbi:MAG TPA: type VII toxin-antitoxin system MntA family adenylyltransferase antitoxin [Candidatus Avalokitesvara rifleensis]|uniref:type VII toxin-antitoxin system MntA family adenylyltransferase antitoxin n=1 Tax=Candidatus Avalokitesvara rifleensis TaxID=3367620 RepID=UPI002712C345|nr:nucleotidyltransferase domain-containing protein [Candidatus Brocadiales bacterium]
MRKSVKAGILKQESIEGLREILTKYFEDKNEVKAAYLYGSIVSGKNVKDSDVDIALLTERYKDRIQGDRARVRYQIEISKLTRKDVDLVFLQEAGELLCFQILETGQVIFERDKEMHRSFRAYRLVECLDFQFLENRMQKGMVAAMRRSTVG